MAVELRVIFEDSGQTADEIAAAVASSLAAKAAGKDTGGTETPRAADPVAGPTATPTPSTSTPDASGPKATTEVKGPRHATDDGSEVGKAGEKLARHVADVVGHVTGLGSSIGAIRRLVDEFRGLLAAVTNGGRSPGGSSSGGSSISQLPAAVAGPRPVPNVEPIAPSASAATSAGEIVPAAIVGARAAPAAGATAGAGAGATAGAGGATAGAGAAAGAGVLAPVAAAAVLVAVPLIAVAGAATLAVGAFKKAFEILGPQVAKLESLNAPLGAAAAQSDIRMELAEISRANKLGPDLAKFEENRGKLEEAWANVVTEILGVVLRFTNDAEPAIKLLTDVLNIIAPAIPAVIELLTAILSLMTFQYSDYKTAMLRAALEIVQVRLAVMNLGKEDPPEIGDDPMFAQFFSAVEGAKRKLPKKWQRLAPDAAGRFPPLEDE